MKTKKTNSFLVIIAIIIVVIGLGALIIFMFKKPFNDGSGCPDADLFSSYGDFIGGFVGSLFALSGFLLLFETLRAQREAMDAQNNEFYHQHQAIAQERFENTFFNLLQFQQNILNDLKITYLHLDSKSEICSEVIEKREIFKYLVTEIKHIDDSIVAPHYNGIYDKSKRGWDDAIEKAHENFEPRYEGDNKLDLEIEKIRATVYKKFTNLIYGITKKNWEQAHERTGIYLLQTIYYYLFNKYHFALGHYFRHLYHILKFISQYETRSRDMARNLNERELISEQCKEYAQLVQAQMSSFELSILYYDSLYYKKMANLVKKYKLLENLNKYDLARTSHYFENEGYNIKTAPITPS